MPDWFVLEVQGLLDKHVRGCSCCSSQILLSCWALSLGVPVGEGGPVSRIVIARRRSQQGPPLCFILLLVLLKVKRLLSIWGRLTTDYGIAAQLN